MSRPGNGTGTLQESKVLNRLEGLEIISSFLPSNPSPIYQPSGNRSGVMVRR